MLKTGKNQKIKLELLKLNKENIRKEYLKKDLKLLADNIERLGLLNNLIVNEEGVILSGNRRYLALKMLNYEYVNVDVINPSKSMEKNILLSANTTQKMVNSWENRKFISNLYWNYFLETYVPVSSKDSGYSEFSRLIGLSLPHTSRILKSQSDEYKDMVENLRKINTPIKVIDALLDMPKDYIHPMYKELYNSIENKKITSRSDMIKYLFLLKTQLNHENKDSLDKKKYRFILSKLKNQLNNIFSLISYFSDEQKEELFNLLDRKKEILKNEKYTFQSQQKP